MYTLNIQCIHKIYKKNVYQKLHTKYTKYTKCKLIRIYTKFIFDIYKVYKCINLNEMSGKLSKRIPY